MIDLFYLLETGRYRYLPTVPTVQVPYWYLSYLLMLKNLHQYFPIRRRKAYTCSKMFSFKISRKIRVRDCRDDNRQCGSRLDQARGGIRRLSRQVQGHRFQTLQRGGLGRCGDPGRTSFFFIGHITLLLPPFNYIGTVRYPVPTYLPTW